MVSVLLVLIGIFIVPFVLSNFLAKSLRVPDSGFGLGLIMFSILASGAVIFAALQPEQPLPYTVMEGDTVQSIVEKYDGLGVKTLTDMNNLQSPDDLTVGKELRIPNPKNLEIKRGVDLSGGVILIYEVDEEQTREATGPGGGDATVDINALVEALGRRINPGGVKEVVIRPYGDKQVEIIVPDVDDAEVDRLKNQITRAGFLRFLIMGNAAKHRRLFQLADAQPNARVIRSGNDIEGEWVPIGRTEDGSGLKVQIDPRVNKIREARSGVIEVLMAHGLFNVEGKHLRNVSKGFDDTLRPAVNFAMGSRGAKLFRGLTTSNLPEGGIESRLGIIMDNELISAPSIKSEISDRGQITGGFSDKYVEEMVNVLRAGRLPAVLKPEPITENRIDPLLGADTIKKGGFAIVSSLIAVLVFMAIYYRFAGLVACFALLLNLMLIVAIMILIRGAFTLPGLAGLVLTVGMSVDANVLIFERIREELRRGAALRMAIRNGFSRATTTIVDANITTLITAIVLYVIGTDQLKGFAVTLILGILMSMFTAIFCSRVIFDIAERRRWLKKMTMTQLLDEPKLDLIGKRKMAAILSLALVVVGLGAVAARRAGMFDIDFLGGTSVQAQLKRAMPYNEVWDRITGIADDVSLTQVNTENNERDTVWKIDTSLENNDELQTKLAETFQDGGESLFISHTVKYAEPRAIGSAPTNPPKSDQPDFTIPPAAALDNAGTSSESGSIGAVTDAEANPEPQTEETQTEEAVPGESAPVETPVETPPVETAPIETAPVETPVEVESTTTPVETLEPAGVGEEAIDVPADGDGARTDLPSENVLAQLDSNVAAPAANPAVSGSTTTLNFEQRVTRDTLVESLRKGAESTGVAEPSWGLTGPGGEADSAAGFRSWTVEANTSQDNLSKILSSMKENLESRPAWLSSSKIGGKVAGDTKNKALLAIVISLVCIVGYLWIRFQNVIFGLAAVVALVHDVLITLGVIALSAYLAKVFGFLMIDEFKISLPVVAAFLTIIGYSLNDTIVVFDRIREVRGRSTDITEEMINTSINQTLSRTVLTSLTTLIVVLILYIFGGQGIHGFAFALLVGVIVGTYSSIFVASPALLWMSQMQKKSSDSKGSRQKAAASS